MSDSGPGHLLPIKYTTDRDRQTDKHTPFTMLPGEKVVISVDGDAGRSADLFRDHRDNFGWPSLVYHPF